MRWVKRILLGLLVVVVLFGAFSLWTVRRSFPQVDGELEVSGLNDPVEVVRDRWGVPHIYASNPHDLFFAQGYTHAQERFWQMDFWRHIGSARLSEMFGESQLSTDRFLRSLDFAGLARQELEMMGDGTRSILESYSEGVNAYLETNSGARVSLEYAILALQNSSYEIEPWTPVNTLTWAKMMSWDLSANMRTEIERAVLVQDLPIERVDQLYPPFPADHPVIVPDGGTALSGAKRADLPRGAVTALASAGENARAVWELTGGGFEGIGSNNWVVGGSRTESGMPLLANDTHLAIQMPSIWFENGLHCVGDDETCPFQVVGFSFAGTPGVVIGHNERIAWGLTNEALDAQDLFIERVNPDNPDQYEVDGEWVDFETRTEIIEVAGGGDVTFEVRSTRHGPVISGTFLDEGELDGTRAVDLPEDYVVALAWQTLEPSTVVEAIVGLNTAAGYDDFREATSKWDIAAQNVVYADVDGNIAYQSTGEVPIRSRGDGRYPVPGWNSEHEWIGVVPFEELPHVLNPPRDFIATANQPVVRGDEPFFSREGSYGYRASRIEELILSSSEHTVETMSQIQFDMRDGGAETLVPYLMGVHDVDDEGVSAMLDVIRDWSQLDQPFHSNGESAGAAAYQATWRHVLMNTFADEFPEDHLPVGGSRWFEVVGLLLQSEADTWWDDASTDEVERRDDILRRSLIDAHNELSELIGDDPSDWSWGELHLADFENQTLGQSGIAPIEWLFNRSAPARVGGSSSIVNAVGWDTDKSFLVDWVPSQRMVVDLADLSSSTFAHTTGQSGHAFHRHYANMIESWTDGDQGPMHWTKDDVTADAESTLTLLPGG